MIQLGVTFSLNPDNFVFGYRKLHEEFDDNIVTIYCFGLGFIDFGFSIMRDKD